MPQQICVLCLGKLNFTCDFIDACQQVEKKMLSTIKKDVTENVIKDNENTKPPTSNQKRQIRISSESPRKKIGLSNADSPNSTNEFPKNQSLTRSYLREICPNAQTNTNLRTQKRSVGSQEDKGNDLTQEAIAGFGTKLIVKEEVDIKEECIPKSMPPPLVNNSMVWIHSSDLLEYKSHASDMLKNNPPFCNKAESNTKICSESNKTVMLDNNLFESKAISCQNNDSSAWNCRKFSKISDLITNEQKQVIETYYTVNENIIDKSAEEVQSNMTVLDKNNIKCNLCSAKYSRRDKCEVHIWAHLNIKPYKCKECSFSTVTLSNVRSHIRKSHLKLKPFNCDICLKQYTTCTLLKDHINTHTGARPYKCKTCDFATATRQTLNNHMEIHMSSGNISCNICGKTFHSRIRMRTHMRIHNNSNVTCKICRGRLSSEKALEVHYKKVHMHDYVCNICSKVLKTRKALYNHMNVHAEAKFKCMKCPNVYKNKHILNEHLLKHEGIRKYKCSVCEKTFAQQSHLAAHNKVHNQPSYKCPSCNKKFNRRDNMKVHMMRSCKSCKEST